MSKTIRPPSRIKVVSPCTAEWDSMIGTDKVRFCEHCNLHVNDVSAMTRAQVMRLITRSSDRICVRYVEPRPNSSLKPREQLYRIGRRVSRIAAGAFTASLSLSSAAAQTQTSPDIQFTAVSMRTAKNSAVSHEKPGALFGVVTDPTGAVVPGASIKLVNKTEHISFTMNSNRNGTYEFSVLNPGTYSMTVEGRGFDRQELPELVLEEKDSREINVRLELPSILAEVDVLAEPLSSENVTSGGAIIALPEEPLVKAAAANDLASIMELVHTTSNVNKADAITEMTALDFAVENGNSEVVRVLLEAGANPQLKNGVERTALMYLRESATAELVQTLMKSGADINFHDESGETPVMNAVTSAPFEVVRVLIEAGAKLDSRDENGKTILFFAAHNQNPEVVKYLISLGADLSARDDNGETPLIVAAEDGSAATVKSLIVAGAEVNAKDDSGYTPLINAAASGNLESVKLLLDAGADVSARNRDGLTALGYVLKFANEEMQLLLKSHGVPE